VASPQARPAFMLVTALMMALSVITLQRCFDESDRKKAMQLVMTAPAPGGTVKDALIAAAADGGIPTCDQPEIVSSCAGTLSVECSIGPGESYRYSVDLVRRLVTPLNAKARALAESARDGGPEALDGGPGSDR
jgi:hypothetical protein